MSNSPASHFRLLHQQPDVLLIPNAWDPASAHLQARSGAKAIATSSAALCWALGYQDGSALPIGELISSVRRMTRTLPVPLTVDLEDGYSNQADEVADLAVEIWEAGAVGINLEDGISSSSILAEKIAAIRSRKRCAALFINARTDVYLRSLAQGPEAVSMVRNRAKQYAEAGADGLFVPGLMLPSDAAQVSTAAKLALNLMALPDMPEIESLRVAGMRRLSAGPALFLSAYATLQRDTNAFLAGQSDAMFGQTLAFARVNELFATSTEA